MTYSGSAYTSQPYGAHVYEVRTRVPIGGVPLINLQFGFVFGPRVGVAVPANLMVQIKTSTTVRGNLSGGLYVPPPIPGSPPTGVSSSGGDIRGASNVFGSISGGRPLVSLAPRRIFGRTSLSSTMRGGSKPPVTYLFGQRINGRSGGYGIMDGGEAAIISAGGTQVTGILSGGIATSALIQLQGYPIVMSPPTSGTLSGGQAVTQLAGRLFLYTGITGRLNPNTTQPVIVQLRARIYTQPVIRGNLTGGKPYIPPPPPPTPTTGNVSFSGTVNMSFKYAFRFTAAPTVIPAAQALPGGPSDVPTDVDSNVASNPRIELLESVGYGSRGPASEIVLEPTRAVHLCGQDVHSPTLAAEFPIPANSDGTPTYSYERWIRVRFTPPFGLIGQFRFWVDPVEIPAGWQVLWGWTYGYQVPTAGESAVALSALPTADPGPSLSNFGDPGSFTGTQTRFSAYLVLQANFLPELTQPGDAVEPLPGFNYNIGFVQS